MRYLALCMVTVVTAALSASAAPAVAPLPTSEDIHKKFEAGDYNGALKDIAQVTALRGQLAAPYDRFEMMTLRGESQLRLKQADAAATAFRQAVKETKEAPKQAEARAMELLIHHTKQLQYTPKTAAKDVKAEPIDIVDPEHRKQAMNAFYEDELQTVTPKLQAAGKGTSLQLVMDAAAALKSHELDALELTAHGNDDQTKDASKVLKKHADELSTRALDDMKKRADMIDELANKTTRQQVPVRQGNGQTGYEDRNVKQGLRGRDVADLKGIIQACGKIAVAAQDLALALGGEKTEAGDLVTKATDIAEHADRTLKANYSY